MKRSLLVLICTFSMVIPLFATIETPAASVRSDASPMAWSGPEFVNVTYAGAILDLSKAEWHVDRYENVTIWYKSQDGNNTNDFLEIQGSGSGLSWDVADGPWCTFVSQDAANMSWYSYELNVTDYVTEFKGHVNPLGNDGWEAGDNHVIYATNAPIWQSFAAFENETKISYGKAPDVVNGAVAAGTTVNLVINGSATQGTENFRFGYLVVWPNGSTVQAWSEPAAEYNADWFNASKPTQNYWNYTLPANITATEGWVVEFKGIIDADPDDIYEAGFPGNRIVYLDLDPPTITKTGPTATEFEIGTAIPLEATIADPGGIFVNGTIKIGAAAATTINMTETISSANKFTYNVPTTGLSAGSLTVTLTVYDIQRYYIGGDPHQKGFHEATTSWTFTLTAPPGSSEESSEEDSPAFLFPVALLGLAAVILWRRKR